MRSFMFRGWKVGQEKFQNYWKALDYAIKVNQHVTFEYFNDVFCNLQGTKVKQDYDYRSEYLKKLFNKPQNLLYSGGSDSHTILHLSEKLGLHWESLLTMLSAPSLEGDANWEYQAGIEYCKQKKLPIEIINHDIVHYERIYQDEFFMYKNAGEINFRPDYFQHSDQFDHTKNYISGHEKPFVLHHEGRWYAWMHDTMMIDLLDLNNIDFFFISPNMPEIFIQDARACRKNFLKNNQYPTTTKIINRDLSRNPLDNYRAKKHYKGYVFNHKNCDAVKEIWGMGRPDIIHNWLNITTKHIEKYGDHLTWESEGYIQQGIPCWLIDIDSLESIDVSEFRSMVKNVL